MTIFITPPDKNDDADEDSAGEEDTNPGIVHFSRNILEARDRDSSEWSWQWHSKQKAKP